MAKTTPLSLAELNHLMQRLQATLELLVGGKTGGVTRSDGSARSGKRDRAAGKELQAKLHDALRGAKNGLSLKEIADGIGGTKETIGYHLRVLRDGKKARVVGTRGTARWHAA